jgi:hypothetical protein
MAEPYVPINRHTVAVALMTELENALNTIDDDVEAIISDKDAALIALISTQQSEKQTHYDLMLGGG